MGRASRWGKAFRRQLREEAPMGEKSGQQQRGEDVKTPERDDAKPVTGQAPDEQGENGEEREEDDD
jgi:hypothetical protein